MQDMRPRLQFVATFLASCAVLSCSPEVPESAPDGTWVGTITTEGNVTTVVNESGSVWGGTATLVEEASIGVDAGEDSYMFGRINGIAARGERIYVLDRQVPMLRVYDFDGRHLADIGGKGAGPGEFDVPFGVAVAPDGRVFVRDTNQGRINVYDEDGTSIDTWTIAAIFFTSRPMVATHNGFLYAPIRLDPDAEVFRRRIAMQGFAPDGTLTDPLVEPYADFETQSVIVRRGTGWGNYPVPFAPTAVWTMAPSGAMVSGIGDEYRYEVRFPDGETMIVRRQIALVPVQPDEADYHRDSLRDRISRARGENGTAEGADPNAIPHTKPAFIGLRVGHQGRVWAIRQGPGEHQESCFGTPDDDPCWQDTFIVDVFDADGRYLGELDIPEGMQHYPEPYISGDLVIAAYDDAAGFPTVKRYRLVLPAEER